MRTSTLYDNDVIDAYAVFLSAYTVVPVAEYRGPLMDSDNTAAVIFHPPYSRGRISAKFF
jgi:hypothetical protein